MRKMTKTYSDKSKAELAKEELNLRSEIAKLILEKKTNPQKDTNTVFKKRKALAVLLTVMHGKKN